MAPSAGVVVFLLVACAAGAAARSEISVLELLGFTSRPSVIEALSMHKYAWHPQTQTRERCLFVHGLGRARRPLLATRLALGRGGAEAHG
jgi:hypothetical protein